MNQWSTIECKRQHWWKQISREKYVKAEPRNIPSFGTCTPRSTREKKNHLQRFQNQQTFSRECFVNHQTSFARHEKLSRDCCREHQMFLASHEISRATDFETICSFVRHQKLSRKCLCIVLNGFRLECVCFVRMFLFVCFHFSAEACIGWIICCWDIISDTFIRRKHAAFSASAGRECIKAFLTESA